MYRFHYFSLGWAPAGRASERTSYELRFRAARPRIGMQCPPGGTLRFFARAVPPCAVRIVQLLGCRVSKAALVSAAFTQYHACLRLTTISERMDMPLDSILSQIAAGKLKLPTGPTAQLSDIVVAHRWMEQNQAAGKIVVLTP